jgi:hypothetical protein
MTIASIMELARSWFAERKMATTPDTMVRAAELVLKLAKERSDEAKRTRWEEPERA